MQLTVLQTFLLSLALSLFALKTLLQTQSGTLCLHRQTKNSSAAFLLKLAYYVCIKKLKAVLQSFLLSLAHYACIRKLKALLQSFLLKLAHYVCINKLKQFCSFLLILAHYVCIDKLKQFCSFLLSLVHYVCVRKLKALLQSFLLCQAHMFASTD